MRSFTDPYGFWLSSLATMRTLGFGDRFDTSTIGVLPMRSRAEFITKIDPPLRRTSAIDMCASFQWPDQGCNPLGPQVYSRLFLSEL